MNLVKEELIDFDELELPDKVYKYRTWSNPCHQTIITDQEVYFAPPSSFEDKLDCKIPLRWNLLTGREIYDKYYLDAQEKHPEWTRQQKRKFARDWTKRSPVKKKEIVAQIELENADKFDVRFGVLSLTAIPDNHSMWEKYSEKGQGFCVGFDPKIMFKFFGGGGKVEYYDTLPDIHPMPKHSFAKQNYLQVFSKERKWEFEQEYRVHKFSKDPFSKNERVIRIPPEAFQEIIFGYNMNESDFNDILSHLDDLRHISLFQAQLLENVVEIKKLK